MFCHRISGPESGNPQASKWWICDVRRGKWSQMWTLTKGTYTGDKAYRDPLQISSNNSSIQPSIWQLSSNRSRVLTWFWHYKVLLRVCSSILRRIQCCRESSSHSTQFGWHNDLLSTQRSNCTGHTRTKSLQEISAILCKHYELKHSIIAKHFHLHKHNQAAGETITDFDAELRKLAIHCEFGEFDTLHNRLCAGYDMIPSSADCFQRKHWPTPRLWNWPKPWKQQNKTRSSSRGLKWQFTSSVGLDLPTPRRSKVTRACPIPGRGTPVSERTQQLCRSPLQVKRGCVSPMWQIGLHHTSVLITDDTVGVEWHAPSERANHITQIKDVEDKDSDDEYLHFRFCFGTL